MAQSEKKLTVNQKNPLFIFLHNTFHICLQLTKLGKAWDNTCVYVCTFTYTYVCILYYTLLSG